MKRDGKKVVSAKQLLDVDGPRRVDWVQVPLSRLVPRAMTAYELVHDGEHHGTLYDVHRPPRHRYESPLMYYRRTKTVDENYTRGWRGWYYCNPAHCKNRWRSKAERDEHLKMAYRILQ
jgi:hypothetical protein